ncbi:MAG: YdcF family protein [Ruminococcus sp.]|nr:YdcF family protein [Ruminococcus sp.]
MFIRIIIAVLLVFSAIHFMTPMLSAIVNIGNITGVAVSVILFFMVVFRGTFAQMFSRMLTHKGGRIFLFTAGGIACIALIGAVVISCFMVKAMNDKPKNSQTTVVVLGCQINGETPSRMLKCRLDAAYDYLSENNDVKVIVSGGQGSDEVTSEADVMRKYLLKRGIEDSRIFMEDKSTSTEENLRFSKEIIDKEGLCGEITIVTDGFHQLRADILAKKQGIEARNISASTEKWLLPTYWIREIYGVAYYLVFK